MADENQLAPGRQTRLTADDESPNQLFLGDPDAAAAVASSQAMAPIIGPYLRDVFTGRAAKQSLMEMFPPTPDWDPNKSALENARAQMRNPLTGQIEISPTAMDMAMGFSGGGLQFRAHHGSGAKFNIFSDKFRRQGEGSNAYSAGLYVAQHPEVARTYQPPGEQILSLDGKPWEMKPAKLGERLSNEDYLSNKARDTVLEHDGNVDRAIQQHREDVQYFEDKARDYGRKGQLGNRDSHLAAAQHNRDTLQFLEKNRDKIEMENKGSHFYDVWVKPEHHEFLDWDLPVSMQEKGVADKITPIMEKLGYHPEDIPHMSGREIYEELVQMRTPKGPGMSADKSFAVREAAREDASKFLNEQGIPGMRFQDLGSRTRPDFRMDYAGEEMFNPRNPLATRLGGIMEDVSNYADLRDVVAGMHRRAVDVEKMYKDAQLTSESRGVPYNITPAEWQKLSDTTKNAKELLDFVDRNEQKFIPRKNEKTYNYVLYHPDHLEITHRDGRKLIPVDYDPVFPEKSKSSYHER